MTKIEFMSTSKEHRIDVGRREVGDIIFWEISFLWTSTIPVTRDSKDN